MSFHKGKQPFECKIYKNIFTFWIKLSEHILSFHKGKKSYYIISSWKKKAISFHKGKKRDHNVLFHEGKKAIDCKIFKTIFTFWIELSEHIAWFHKGKKRDHIVSVHERKKQFECKICQNIFYILNWVKWTHGIIS